jgi:hypothetical protein
MSKQKTPSLDQAWSEIFLLLLKHSLTFMQKEKAHQNDGLTESHGRPLFTTWQW